MSDLSGAVAMVTGGGSGIGRASALAFARAGAKVAVADLLADRAEAVVDEIRRAGGDALPVTCDLRRPQHAAGLADQVVQAYGRLDCAFNNAGVGGPIQPLDEYPDEAWDDVIATNLTSIFHCMKGEVRQMLKQGGGSIVNCASITGLAGTRGMSAYSASKHGILGLTKTAALEYATRGIRINAVCPGTIHTPAMDDFIRQDPERSQPFIDAMVAAQPIGRLGRPEEVAEAVVWLSSPRASLAVGSGLVIDGGYLAQ